MWAECIYPLEARHSIKDTPTLCESCYCGLILNVIPTRDFYIFKRQIRRIKHDTFAAYDRYTLSAEIYCPKFGDR